MRLTRTRAVAAAAAPGTDVGGAGWVLAAAVLWGTTGTAQALAGSAADPLTVGAVRLAVGSLALLGAAALRGALRSLGGVRWPGLVAAAVCMAAYQPLFFAGVGRTGVAVGTVVGIGSAPVAAGLLGALFRREVPNGRWVAATALTLLGCVLLAVPGREVAADPVGILLAAGAGTAYAGYSAITKGLVRRHGPDGVAAVVFSLAALLLLPLLWRGNLSWLGQARGLAVALHLGLVATAAAYLLFHRGLARVPVGTAATLSLAEPATATVLGVVVLGERLAPVTWAGVGAILAGLVVLAAGPAGSRQAAGG